VIGGASVFSLYGNLLAPINDQLHRTASISERNAGVDSGSDTPGGNSGNTPGLQQGSIVAQSVGSTTVAQLQTFGGSPTTLTAAQRAPFLTIAASNDPTTLTIPGIGDFRAVRTVELTGVNAAGATVKYYNYFAFPLADTQATLVRFGLTLGGISLLGILLVALATWFIVSYALRPLRRVAATATEVASMELDRGDVDLSVRVPDADTDQRTEVGQVGAALNSMLGHVDDALRARQASESKVRQFVADASHELRTPLASIRGYAELTRRGNHDLPDDVTHSIGRVESEAVRMTSLVEDLLLLARLDEGRDLEHSPVDLTLLLVDCVGDAHVAGDDHEWALELPEQPVTVLGDGQRIHQVIANLLSNARVHTPAGTNVITELSVTEGRAAVITVTDDGPGIPPDLSATLFERFARGDSSRARSSGSTGLGLAIVKAVVDGHGGDVSVTSEPGRTRFRVELPGVLEAS
jgi:two-component system OmpR family sensor kinase